MQIANLVSTSSGSTITSSAVTTIADDAELVLSHPTVTLGSCMASVKRKLPFGANSILLLHCDGADASTTFTNEFSKITVTASGDAQVDTAQKKFGTGSALFDGTDDYLQSDNSPYLNLGTKWRIDFFVRFSSVAGTQKIISTRGSGGGAANGYEVLLLGGVLGFEGNGSNNTGGAQVGTTTILVDTWYFVSVVTTAGATKLYVDAIEEQSYNNVFTWETNNNLRIGKPSNFAEPFFGWLDEVRITRGDAVDLTVTVPVSAFTTTAYADEYEGIDCDSYVRATTGFGVSTSPTSTKFKNLTGISADYVCSILT